MPQDAASTPAGVPRSNVVLAMLLAVYVLNFVDRQILSILAAPIQAELNIDDARMGLLGGIAFALLYSMLGVPLALLADRASRTWVITGALVVWSVFTALCGMAQNFWQLFGARVGVGVGEAGGVAPSYALIGDYFPSERRAFALSIYSLGIPLGSAIGVLAGGYIAATINWRIAFLVVGAAGVLLAPLFRLLVADRPRPIARLGETLPSQPRLGDVARLLAAKPSFWLLTFGATASSMLGYGLGFWLPSLLQRSYGLNLVQTSHFIGVILLLGGVGGMLAGGSIADRLGQTDRAWYGRVPAIAFVAAVPLFAAGILNDNVWLAFVLFLIPQAFAYVWLGPVLSSIQHLVEPRARSMASSLFLLINNLIGLGGGIYALGALSTALTPHYGADALRYSMLYALGLYGVAALLMVLGGNALRRDWVDEA
ncbi:MFS transporter [Novosphingobium sp. KCTC 2891]|uniref:spinster family MFS transporter n=1 Tax=Novosphingobium sp. KCTC 2891 TaxID=2989730 RepID=UPI0022220D3F|nr:MFS transporter [Novosphingobium sp. KCTC 2891]MCW1381908.1 MFS transporter [Novosphingobium sp. KCTC 2891]